MPLYRLAMLLIGTAVLSGCAAQITAWKNDPIQSYAAYREVTDKPGDKPREALIGSIMTMTGDCRTVVNIDGNICAESMPDAVTVFTGASKGSLSKGGIKVDLSDATGAGILQTYQRTESDSLMRQLGWNACLAWAQKAISQEQYHALLKMLFDAGADVMRTRARQEVKSAANGSLIVPAPAIPGATASPANTTPVQPSPPQAPAPPNPAGVPPAGG